jgi:hypothetical protein
MKKRKRRYFGGSSMPNQQKKGLEVKSISNKDGVLFKKPPIYKIRNPFEK